jgi:nitrate reductase NapE component
MAKEQPGKPTFIQGLKQLPMAMKFTAKRDKWFTPLALAAVLLPLIAVGVAIAFGAAWFWIGAAVMTSLLGVLIVLNLRANKAMMKEYEGQPGAAAQILQSMRGDWRVRPAFSSTTQFDMVHIVLGRPGIILVAEGNPQRLKSLLAQEKRRLVKVIGSTELRDYIVGEDEGQLPLKKIRTTLMRLPRTITGKDVNALDARITALGSRTQMPKGAIPKNMRPPKGAFRAMRGR